MKNGYQSLRKIAKYFEIFIGIKISHQSIKNWITFDVKDRIENEKHPYSGYYVYDEQFLRLNGIRHYRLLLYDAKLNIPVSEKIVRHRIPKTTETFIKESTKNKPFISLTTDLFPMYRNLTDKLQVKHQLCKFHLYKTINHKIKVYCRKNKLSKKEKTAIYKNAKQLKKVFQEKTKKESIERFKQYLKNSNKIPTVLNEFIRKHITNHFTRYIQHLNDENIPKTSNKAENYYRQTDPEKIKKKYKTKKGILSYLTYQMENWTEKHGKIKKA